MLSAFLNKEIISDFVFDLHGGNNYIIAICQWSIFLN